MTCFRCTTPVRCAVWGCAPGTFPSEKRDPNPQPLTPGQQEVFDAIPLIERSYPAGYIDPRHSKASTSTASTAPPTALTLEKVKAALDAVGPEPIGEWMREKGFPPESSLLFLPLVMRDQLPFWPSYVRFTAYVHAPMLARDAKADWVPVEYLR